MIDVSPPLARAQGFHVAFAFGLSDLPLFSNYATHPQNGRSEDLCAQYNTTMQYVLYGSKVVIGSISFRILCTNETERERATGLGTTIEILKY